MSQVERIEARRHALQLLASVAHAPKCIVQQSDVVANLRQAAQQRAGTDWARGVEEVLACLD